MAVMPYWQYPRLIAHRCGGALAPENTLAGLEVSARLGVVAVEFDVMLSADGVPLLIHDETLERTTTGTGAVASRTAAELRLLDAGLRHHPAFAGERIPAFQEALAHCQRLGLAANIEIKPAPGHEVETGRVVAETLLAFLKAQATDGKGRTALLLSSFSQQALSAANQAGVTAAGLPCALLFEEVPADWQDCLQRLGCQFLHCDAANLDEFRLAEIRAAGVTLACYTVNDREQARQLYEQGVSAVFSDRPDILLGSAHETEKIVR